MSDVLRIPDKRVRPSPDLDEREMLIAFLDWYRELILVKLDGLDREALTRRLVPSRTTLLGILKHLIYVERGWFEVDLAGGTEIPQDENDPDMDWVLAEDESARDLVAEYRAVCAQSNAIARRMASLDEHARASGREKFTVRWILTHMVEETARHAGHADILREQIDGRAGF